MHCSYRSFLLTELGVGCAPAFAADDAELEFIKDKQRLSSDNRNFWFGGGSVNLSLQSQGYSPGTERSLIRLCAHSS